jgi:hypothetical protein
MLFQFPSFERTWLKEMANFVQSVWTPALNTDLSKQVPPVEVVIYLLRTPSFSATNNTNDCILTLLIGYLQIISIKQSFTHIFLQLFFIKIC